MRGTRLLPWLLIAPAILVTGLFLLLPLSFISLISLTQRDSFFFGPIFTLDNYVGLATRYRPNLYVTVKLAFLAATVDLVLGYPFAYLLARKIKYRDLVRAAMAFPLFGALYIAFGLKFVFLPGSVLDPLFRLAGIQGVQVLYGLPSVVFAMALFTFPFMVMNVIAALANVDPRLEEAAICLGAPRRTVFWRVLLPLSRSGILAGFLMSFGWNLGTFAEPLILGSLNEQRALAWTLYQRGVVQLDYGLSAAMGAVLMLLAFSVTYLFLRYSRGALAQ